MEFTSKALEEWAYRRDVKLDFIHPGQPNEIAPIESFNGQLRNECLTVMQFELIEDASEKIEAWRIDCNDHRSHSSLGHLTPKGYAQNRRAKRTSKLAVEYVYNWSANHEACGSQRRHVDLSTPDPVEASQSSLAGRCM